MTTEPDPGSRIEIDTAPNLRDLGGWPVAGGGQVRRGLVYRSAELHGLGGADLDAFAALGIATVFDLRTSAERDLQPDQLPDHVTEVHLDVLSDATDAAPAQLLQVLGDPAAAQAALGDGKAIAIFEKGYRDIVGLPSALEAYRHFFLELAVPHQRPALFHCTTGKDRTGWAAASLLALLGVDDDDIRSDYLLTNEELRSWVQPVYDKFAAAGGDADLLRPVLGVDERYLAAAMDEMRTRFGTIEGYFTTGLGLDRKVLETLRGVLIAS